VDEAVRDELDDVFGLVVEVEEGGNVGDGDEGVLAQQLNAVPPPVRGAARQLGGGGVVVEEFLFHEVLYAEEFIVEFRLIWTLIK